MGSHSVYLPSDTSEHLTPARQADTWFTYHKMVYLSASN